MGFDSNSIPPDHRNGTLRERDSTNAVPPHLRRDVFRYPGDMASTRGGLISVWPCASEESESTLREADVLATLPMYDPGLLASWYRRRVLSDSSEAHGQPM